MPDFPAKQRQKLADKGQAMPQGGFPIRNRADLKRAIQAIGRASNPDAAKAWIRKRARELNATDLLPESWSAAHSALGGDMLKEKPSLAELTELQHHGVKGMRWGVRSRSSGGGGVLRTQAARRTQRQINIHTAFRDQKGRTPAHTAVIKGLSVVDKNTWGRNGRWEGYHNKKISQLERSQQRISQGELIARTLIAGPKYSKK